MTWVLVAAMAVIAAVALLLPLRKTRRETVARSAYDMEIYRDQLAELDRDQARGLIGETEAKAARTEIARRMLAADREEKPQASARSSRPLAVALTALAPAVAIALYLGFGAPSIPSMPFAERAPDAESQDMVRRVATLAERLQKNPDDLNGWALLARSLTALDRLSEATTAWRRALALSGNAPEYAGALAENLVRAGNGTVSPEARDLFARVRAAAPFDPRAMFYEGLAQSQEGDLRGAAQTWTDLIATAPQDAPWLPAVRDRLQQTASAARIDLATITPSAEAQRAAETRTPAPNGPGAADVEAMQRLSPEERIKAIRSMVDNLAARLEKEPNDLEGWRRLGRAWRVLGEHAKAAEALSKAAALAPDRVDVLSDYAGALLDQSQSGALPAEFIAVMRRILAVDPDYPDALWFVGLAEAEAGNRNQAATLWQKLLAQLPPDSREHAEIKQRLDGLKTN